MMDFNSFGLAKYTWVMLILIQTQCASYYGRDIILTPNKTLQYHGKVVYFKPIDKENAPKQRSIKETVPTSQVLWEEPLKHATYLVLNNKIDGNDNSSDFLSEAQLQTATYVRRAHESFQKFGDVVSLARGRLETDENNKFVYKEMDRNECRQLNCSLHENNNKNITAFWLVEKIRHRDEKLHRYELRITIFPVKKNRLEKYQPKRRSFLIREQDYPEYFDETMKPNSKIQERFFDLVGSLSERPYEEYRIPFTVDGYRKRNPGDLNTGEYYHPKGNGEEYYDRPTAASNSYGRPIQFPDVIPTAENLFDATRKHAINPVTSTHLHHHYYLNRNNIPLIKATGYDKETIFENDSRDFEQQIRIRNPQVVDVPFHQQSDQKQTGKEHELIVAPQNNAIPTAIGAGYNFYTETPVNGYDVSSPSSYIFGNHKNLQAPYTISEQSPVPPFQFGQFYQQTPYSHPLQLQVVTPPQQYTGGSLGNSPITVAPFNTGQHYPIESLRPVIDFPSRFNRQQFPIQNNDVNYNQQFEPNRYSEPDPIYHGENVPLPPYTRQVGFDPVIDIGNHQQQQQPTQSPNQIENTKSEQYTTSDYEVNVSDVKNRPERHRVKAQIDNLHRNESQRKYPDSINAQLPPPEQDDDLTVPYVESSVVTQKSVVQSTSVEANNYHKHSSAYENSKRLRVRGYTGHRTTTEKPILKWMPKKTKAKGFLTESDEGDLSKAFATTTETVITVVPVNSYSEEPRTSVSTSVSVKVGSSSTPATPTDSHQLNGSIINSTGNQATENYNGFLPTINPNLHVVREDAVETNTSNFKLFRSKKVAEEDVVNQSTVTDSSNL
ncbi:hypothetical protein Bhyg_14097 [Pseudolycoriella hygida]|uniref:Uncharacterized protein n=1 Tax=Pseudolycoriella hygida TaxID=35572 RepID=A0A9Q0MPD4_9DIPT|nr:hypothetical protein Bhyg_14097 [Pseudolycoriella hygida]